MWNEGLVGKPAEICRYCKGYRQQDAPRSPRPSGLRPGRASALLPRLALSTYTLRRAPRIHPVLAATHRAPTIEIGSEHGHGTDSRHRGQRATHPRDFHDRVRPDLGVPDPLRSIPAHTDL